MVINIILLVGRMTANAEMRSVGDNHNVTNITLAVRRDFKNSDGTYETDFVPITLWEGMAQICCDICKKGSLVSLKGRLAVNKREIEGKTYNFLEIIGEKIALLHNPKTEEEA